MEEFPQRAELGKMQREQERERRRIRDRQRRQSMTQEQRERHLARRRRNYQLRRQRAATARFIPHGLESSTGEVSTSGEHQRVTSSTSDYTVLYNNGVPPAPSQEEKLNLDINYFDESVHLEALGYKPTNSPVRLRLNHIRRIARNMMHPISAGAENVSHQVAADLMAKVDASANGSAPKSLRLIRVKRLARSLKSPSKETAAQNHNVEQNLPREGIQSNGKRLCPLVTFEERR